MGVIQSYFGTLKYDLLIFDKKNKTQIKFKPDHRYWCADPFLVEDKGTTYVFCEMFKNKENYGCISVSRVENGKMTKPEVVIDTGSHMSFPNVFMHNGEYYMLPESGDARQVALYKAVNFPMEWKLEKVLIDDVVFCDSIIDWKNELLITYDQPNQELLVYSFDIENLEVKELIDKRSDVFNIMRPAGKIIEKNGHYARPAQMTIMNYGEGTMFYEIKGVVDGKYEETILDDNQFDYIQYVLPYMSDNSIDGIHTINESEHYVVVDLFYKYKSFYEFYYKVLRKLGLVKKK